MFLLVPQQSSSDLITCVISTYYDSPSVWVDAAHAGAFPPDNLIRHVIFGPYLTPRDTPPRPPLRALRRRRPGAGTIRRRTRLRRALPARPADYPRPPRKVLGPAHPGGRARPQPRPRSLAPRQPGPGPPQVRLQPRGPGPGRTGDRPQAGHPHVRGSGRGGHRHSRNGLEARQQIRAGLEVDPPQLRDAKARTRGP